MDWVITTAEVQDAGEIMTVQRAAYVSEARLYDNTRLSALSEPMEEIRKSITADQVLVAKMGSRIVGSVRGVLQDDECHVGRLVVAPDMQGRGIGAALLRAIEEHGIKGVRRFVLHTGDRSKANINLYRKVGYTETPSRSHRRDAVPGLPGEAGGIRRVCRFTARHLRPPPALDLVATTPPKPHTLVSPPHPTTP
jgi:ribosomal protein S18 acetylase RimI-like enzyme